jgi:hypothetical protein
MFVQFTRPDVAAKYEATIEVDITLHTGCYSGRFSNINMCGADVMYSTKHPAIKLKEVAPATSSSTASAE